MFFKTVEFQRCLFKWWFRTESNCRHEDFQSSALPTELRNHIWRFRRELNPRSSAWQADVITATLRNHGCGSWIWTNDLRVMSPTSYQTAPSRDINLNGGERGIRTPAPFPTSRFSRPVPSTRLGYFSMWCLRPDLNRHGIWLPQDFKSCASTYFATQAIKSLSRLI